MSDSKCKSNVVSQGVVLNTTVEQIYRLGEDNCNDGLDAIFALLIIPFSLSNTVNGLVIVIRGLEQRQRILNHLNHCLGQGTILILTLLKSPCDVALFQLLKGQASVINIMIIRWGMTILSGGCCKFGSIT